MPRPSKGIRLWLRPARRKDKKFIANSIWIIIDGRKHIATGCLKHQIEDAEEKLAEYIAEKKREKSEHGDDLRHISQIDIADVLSTYLDDCGPRMVDQHKLELCVARLNEYWGGRMLSDVTARECRAYVKSRGKPGGARADLETLRAAINHHAKENLHDGNVRIVLPPKGPPRDRWLTRHEAAQLIWVCWQYRERQTIHRGQRTGQHINTRKHPLRHLARFILIGLYTGTRASAIASSSPYRKEGHSFVDLEAGIFHRLAAGKRGTNKRQPPAPIPARLLAHMRRWVRRGVVTSHFVEWHGMPVKSVKTAFDHAVGLAKLPGRVTPHTLRHTAATWLMQRGCLLWEAAGYLGMSVEMLEKTYGHHHPDFLREAARAITSKQPQNVPLVISLVERKPRHKKRQ